MRVRQRRVVRRTYSILPANRDEFGPQSTGTVMCTVKMKKSMEVEEKPFSMLFIVLAIRLYFELLSLDSLLVSLSSSLRIAIAKKRRSGTPWVYDLIA